MSDKLPWEVAAVDYQELERMKKDRESGPPLPPNNFPKFNVPRQKSRSNPQNRLPYGVCHAYIKGKAYIYMHDLAICLQYSFDSIYSCVFLSSRNE